MREILTICPSPRRTRGRLSGKAPTRRRPIYCVPSAHFGELEDPFVLPRRSPSWAVPDAASCHPARLLCHLYYFMCSGHHLCISCVFPFVSQPTPDPPLHVSTDVVFGGGWKLANETNYC